MTRFFVRRALWSLRMAERFAAARDKMVLRKCCPLLRYLLLPPAERSKAMSKS